MTFEVVFTKRAERDFETILNYIEFNNLDRINSANKYRSYSLAIDANIVRYFPPNYK